MAGVHDSGYLADGFEGEGADSTAHLIRFSADFLSDFESLPWYTIEIIKKQRKQELFERFALDNLAGVILLTKDTPAASLQGKLRRIALNAVDEETLQERAESVRSATLKPDFENEL